jgi:hypothetical protein
MTKTVTIYSLVIRFSQQTKVKLCLVNSKLTVRKRRRMTKPLFILVGLGPILIILQVGTQSVTPMSIILKVGLRRPQLKISNWYLRDSKKTLAMDLVENKTFCFSLVKGIMMNLYLMSNSLCQYFKHSGSH